MSAFHAGKAVQDRVRAAEEAWVVHQRMVLGLSVAAIATLAAMPPVWLEGVRLADTGGIGRAVSQRTVRRWLEEEREQYREDFVKRPIIDMVQEEDARLEHLAAMHMTDARSLGVGSAERATSLDRYLRVLESRRKLLGLDRPTKIELDDRRVDVVPDDELAAMRAVQERLRA